MDLSIAIIFLGDNIVGLFFENIHRDLVFTPSKCKSWMVKKSDRKNMIYLKYSVGSVLCKCPRPPERRTSGSESKYAWNIVRGRNDKTAAVLVCVHLEKAGLFGKGNNPKKNRRKR